MLKLLVLQQWYGLSDPELERQVARGVIFQHFLGFLGYWTKPHYGLTIHGEDALLSFVGVGLSLLTFTSPSPL